MTGIEWTDETWNPVSGCSKVSEGCRNCYAETYAHRFWKDRKFTDVQCHGDRLNQPLHWKKPRRVFVNSMSDLFHPDVSEDFIDRVFAVMALCPQHTFQILTKRPERMRGYFQSIGGTTRRDWVVMQASRLLDTSQIKHFAWPLPNVWLGVSVEEQKTANERIPVLLGIPAAVRFVSYEPALGPVDFKKILLHCPKHDANWEFCSIRCSAPESIDWVIVGGESGANARPMHPDWARSVSDQCQEAGVPFFFKQWGEWWPVVDVLPGSAPFTKMGRRHDWPDGLYSYRIGRKVKAQALDGRVFKEFPKEIK